MVTARYEKSVLCSLASFSRSPFLLPILPKRSRLFLPCSSLVSPLGGSQGVGVKPLRSAGLVALALKGLWVVG